MSLPCRNLKISQGRSGFALGGSGVGFGVGGRGRWRRGRSGEGGKGGEGGEGRSDRLRFKWVWLLDGDSYSDRHGGDLGRQCRIVVEGWRSWSR